MSYINKPIKLCAQITDRKQGHKEISKAKIWFLKRPRSRKRLKILSLEITSDAVEIEIILNYYKTILCQ